MKTWEILEKKLQTRKLIVTALQWAEWNSDNDA
jgi:hypothetical protein